MDRFKALTRAGLTAAITVVLTLFTASALGQASTPNGTPANPAGVAPVSTPAGSSVPALVSASGQLMDTRLALLEQSVAALKEQNGALQKELESKTATIQAALGDKLKTYDERAAKVESLWTVSLGQSIAWWWAAAMTLGVFSIIVGLIKFFLMPEFKVIVEKGRDGLDQIVIERIFGKDQIRLSKSIEAQLQANNRTILARDKRIHLMTREGELTDDESRELQRLQAFMRSLGFYRQDASVEDAELVVIVGRNACSSRSTELATVLKNQLVPVVLYFGPGRLDPDPTPDFALAVIANSLPTALMHLHNLAMLPISRTATSVPA